MLLRERACCKLVQNTEPLPTLVRYRHTKLNYDQSLRNILNFCALFAECMNAKLCDGIARVQLMNHASEVF